MNYIDIDNTMIKTLAINKAYIDILIQHVRYALNTQPPDAPEREYNVKLSENLSMVLELLNTAIYIEIERTCSK